MENFILGNLAGESSAERERISFLATRMQWQCVHSGTREMIDEMLIDLGLADIAYREWSIRYVRTQHYLSDGESPTSPDSWADAWEIALVTTAPSGDLRASLLRRANDRRDIARSFARDTTWGGKELPAAAPYVIVARFYHDRLFARVLAALAAVRDTGPPADTEIADLIEAIRACPGSSQVSVGRRADDVREITIELGEHDAAQFAASGSALAEAVTALVHELGGTVTWDERIEFLAESARH